MTPLRQRMIEDMQVRNLALNTQRSYLEQVSRFSRHFNKSPEQLGPDDIRAYQVYLTNEKKLAPSSIVTAVAALRFVYKVSLKKNWQFERGSHSRTHYSHWKVTKTPKSSSCPWLRLQGPRYGVSCKWS